MLSDPVSSTEAKMQRVKVSSKFQIALPSSVRKRLDIRQGDELIVDVRGSHIVLMREPQDYAAALAGLHADVWEGIDAQAYVRELREACDH
jgi:AbrB family looped-hinge helix DNA binding protein